MKNIIIGIVVGGFIVGVVFALFPKIVTKEVITEKTIEKEISVLAEQKKCEKAGGSFDITDSHRVRK